MYCFGIHQPLFEEMEKTIPNITFYQGLPSPEVIDDFTADRRHRVIVLDDLMHRVVQNVDMELLFTQGCHHRKLSVVFITQNIFHRGTKSRTIALNTTYLVMMKNVSDVSQVATLGRQLSRTIQDIDVRFRRRHFASVRIPGHGHVTSLGRHLQTENTRVPGRGPDSVRSQAFIRGRTRDGREKMGRLLEQDHFLELLRTTRKLQRQTLLRTIDKLQLKALSEIAHNVIKGSVILSPSDKNRMKKNKKVLSVLGK